ncbi:hypothetical protein [Prescottella agglutinans]|uniref:Uncharacterized protein n=1 Tax=Prescottella agglutinans TaxID=1644129 RepID=A0ABT6MIF6_9NOCA|nr:hypothetical protein [Prescottella agglutinans]MDH6284020.1 hypothetical protein [Prescottella agglutinans]
MNEQHNHLDYYCAARDGEGNIRMDCGRGLLVARSEDSRATVQGWFDQSQPGRFREQYRAALTLIDRERKAFRKAFRDASKALGPQRGYLNENGTWIGPGDVA